MRGRRKVTADDKREAVAMLHAPGVTVRQIAADLGIGATVLGRWRRDTPGPAAGLRRQRAIPGGRAKSDQAGVAGVTKEQDFLREAATFFAKTPIGTPLFVNLCSHANKSKPFFF